jgi:hypothetical protein
MDARHSSEQKHTLLVEDTERSVPPRLPYCSAQTHWKTIALIVLLVLSNLLLLALLLVPRPSVASKLPASTEVDPNILAQIGRLSAWPSIWLSIITCTITDAEPPAIVPPLPKKAVQFSWYTPYNNVENQTASNELWDKISSSHGLIALNHQSAKEKQWLESMPVPGDEGKGLYLLESYHQLHCLVSPASPPARKASQELTCAWQKIVRTMLLQSIDNEPLSKPASHALHCFDYFRQVSRLQHHVPTFAAWD